MRSSVAGNRYRVAEFDWIGAPLRAWRGEAFPGALYCHGAGGTALKTASNDEFPTILELAETRATMSADWGYDSWGSDTAVTRMGEGLAYLRANLGVTGPVVIVCASMGFVTASNFAVRYPNDVAAIAGVVPCVNIQSIIDIAPEYKPTIDAAYGGNYRDNVEGLTHSPIKFAANLSPTLPIKLWSLPSDTLTTPASQYAFVAARPQTQITNITDPAIYHGGVAVEWARPAVIQWIKEVAP